MFMYLFAYVLSRLSVIHSSPTTSYMSSFPMKARCCALATVLFLDFFEPVSIIIMRHCAMSSMDLSTYSDIC